MMEKYEGIKNGTPNTYDAPDMFNVTVRTQTPGGHELELRSPVREITY